MTKYKYNYSIEHVDIEAQNIQTISSFKTNDFDEIVVHISKIVELHQDRSYLDKCLVTEWDRSGDCWPLMRSVPFEYFVSKMLQFIMLSDEEIDFKI